MHSQLVISRGYFYLAWKGYDSTYFVVCTLNSCFGYFERVGLYCSRAIAGNGNLANSRLCNVMVKCCLMVITGFVYLFVN